MKGFALLLLAIFLIGCSPSAPEFEDSNVQVAEVMNEVISNYIVEKYVSINSTTDKQIEVHKIYGTSEENDIISVYLYSYFGGFNISTGTESQFGHSLPAVVQLKKVDQGYEVVKYIEPKDGNEYLTSLNKMFPEKYVKMMQQDTGNIEELEKEMTNEVERWLEEIR